jgi:hypothetical protein
VYSVPCAAAMKKPHARSRSIGALIGQRAGSA